MVLYGPLNLKISQKIYLFKIDNRSTRTNVCNSYMFEVNNKDTKAMSMTLFWHISYLFLVLLSLTLTTLMFLLTQYSWGRRFSTFSPPLLIRRLYNQRLAPYVILDFTHNKTLNSQWRDMQTLMIIKTFS